MTNFLSLSLSFFILSKIHQLSFFALSTDTAKESRRYNVSLEVSGPNWSLLTLAPRPGVSVLTWSLSQDLQPGADWLDRQTFFVNLIQG